MTLSALVEFRADLLVHGNDVESEEICDSIATLSESIACEIMSAPIESKADAAAKLRLVADLIDDEAGTYFREGEYLRQAVAQIAEWRRSEYKREFSRPHPQYAA